MNIRFKLFIIAIIILIVCFSITGILLPKYLLTENIIIFQIIFTSLLIGLTAFAALFYLNRNLSNLYRFINEKAGNDSHLNLIKMEENGLFPNINYFLNNSVQIVEKFNDFIIEQDILLNKYSMLNKKLKKLNDIRDAILNVSNSILRINNLEDLFNMILKNAIKIIDDAEKGTILIFNEEGLLEYKSAIGFNYKKLKRVKLKLEETFLYNANNGDITKPCIIKDVRSFNCFNLNHETYKTMEEADALDIKATLSAPIIIDDRLYGMINVDSIIENGFNEEDLFLMEYFSNQISIAIKNHQLIEKTLYLSRYDSLTNIYNRCYFEELLNKFYKKALRYNESFCLTVFDLNDLKYINDTFGHIIGDKLISSFAKTIRENIRETDLFARYGGDEFIGVFFDCDTDKINKKIRCINKIFKENPLTINGKRVVITFSYGIANFPNDSKDLSVLLQQADKRMYEYKKNWKNKYSILTFE